ncbi:MAG TPA: universal stress protein [Terracidiphilus sp.]|nr:universal stress protein [Terracidiphilus sp.]
MANEGNRPEASVNAVVYATDFSICSENAGNYARLLAVHFSATLLVAHAFHLTQAAMEVEAGHRAMSKQREDLQKLLTQRADALSSESLKAVPFLLEGSLQEAIPALAEKHAPSLIVLGTHGAGRFKHEIIGSMAEKILRSTRRPCLTVGPHAPQSAAADPPFRRILYATDFSPSAAHAAVFALTFAHLEGGDIDVLNVIPENAAGEPGRLAELEERYRHALDELVPQQTGEFCSPHTFVKTGKAHDRIMGHIRENNIDLLVLGIRKSSHLGLEMRTSGAFRLIADAPCPVLTITG